MAAAPVGFVADRVIVVLVVVVVVVVAVRFTVAVAGFSSLVAPSYAKQQR